MKFFSLIIACLLLFHTQINGQKEFPEEIAQKMDSILSIPNTRPFQIEDDIMNLGKILRHQNVFLAEIYLDSVIKYARHHHLTFLEGYLYTEFAEVYRIQNRSDLMFVYYDSTISFFNNFRDKYPDSLQSKTMYAIGAAYNNVADGYLSFGMYDKALTFYKSSLENIYSKDDKLQYSIRYYNISDVYVRMHQTDSALKYILLSKELEEQMNTDDGLAFAHEGIAKVLNEEGKYEEALNEIDIAIAYIKKVNDYYLQIDISFLKGKILMDAKRWQEAKVFFEDLRALSEQTNYLTLLEDCYINLKIINKELENYKDAYRYAELLLAINDSTLIKRAEAKASEFDLKYEAELKDKEILYLNEQNLLKEKINDGLIEQKELEKSQNRLEKFAMFGGIVLLAIIGLILYLGSRKKMQLNTSLKVSNKELEYKNLKIQQQSAEIRDSINYAKNIQTAVLPDLSSIENFVSDSFVFYSPKDVVSGDFYWTFHSDRLDITFIAVADCTGHGVPGAFMSILGISILDKIIIQLKDLSCDKILTALNTELYNTLSKEDGSGVIDGMDIAIIGIDHNRQKISFAGARNSMVITHKNKTQEIKGTRFDLGRSKEIENIDLREITYENGAMIYLFTDGFADQKGGAAGKKYYKKPFLDFLSKISNQDANQQRASLQNEFKEWKSYGKEQIDDVLVLGIRLG